MNNSNRILLASLFALAIFAYLFRGLFLPNEFKYDWRVRLNPSGDQPYDLELFYDVLEASVDSYRVNTRPLEWGSLPENGKGTYMFVGNHAQYDTTDVAILKSFAENGGSVYISTTDIPYQIGRDFGFNFSRIYSYHYTDSVEFTFNTSGAKFGLQVWNKGLPYDGHAWKTLNSDSIVWLYGKDPIDFEVHTEVDGKPSAWRLPYGKGEFIFQLNPIIHSNFFIAQDQGYAFENEVFANLQEPIIYDAFAPFYVQRNTSNYSPLNFIFKYEGMRFAWYFLLGGFFLFLTFRGKRKQKEIPLLAPTKNTSIEFAKALGTLYHDKGNPSYLAEEIMNQFHSYNRRRYHVHPGKPGEWNTEVLAKKSRVPKDIIEKLYQLERKVRYNPQAEIGEVLPLYKQVQTYYSNAK